MAMFTKQERYELEMKSMGYHDAVLFFPHAPKPIRRGNRAYDAAHLKTWRRMAQRERAYRQAEREAGR